MASPLPFQPHTKIEPFPEPSATPLATAGPGTTNTPVGFASISDPPFHQVFLTKSEEDYFLNAYWHSYNALVPIVYQPDFEQLYNNLWDKINYEQYPQATRQAYPLIDIVLALCLQYGMNGALGNQHRTHDAVLEGRRYYERCLHHIRTELEHPHIGTLQCYILCTIYLLNASKVNTAYHMLGLAVRIAYNLGIHKELDDPSLKLGRRQLYRRIW